METISFAGVALIAGIWFQICNTKALFQRRCLINKMYEIRNVDFINSFDSVSYCRHVVHLFFSGIRQSSTEKNSGVTMKPIDDEVVEGYQDGFNDIRLEFPDLSNRSDAYRHGWLNGRDDRIGSPRASAADIRSQIAEIRNRTGAAWY